ncbi:MGMT family protein [Candidatus Peregrinibacteria bacterium]|nr:MGMT family protein [Candidatus Peregrinibacteria bacterium]
MHRKRFTIRALQGLLEKIPHGKVVTYQEIARALGNPKAARAIGVLCSKNPEPEKYPCFRVVRSDGTLGGYSGNDGIRGKIQKLEHDGVFVRDKKIVDFKNRTYFFPLPHA